MDGSPSKGSRRSAAAGRRAADESGLREALDDLGHGSCRGDRSGRGRDQVADEDRMLGVRAVIGRSEALAAELAGSRFSLAELAEDEAPTGRLPRRSAERGA